MTTLWCKLRKVSTRDKNQIKHFVLFMQILQITDAMNMVNISLITNDQNALIYEGTLLKDPVEYA